jgi:hypothetical protein
MFFRLSLREIAWSAHSGADPEPGQDSGDQDVPDDYESANE